jgi:hypothetical protein
MAARSSGTTKDLMNVADILAKPPVLSEFQNTLNGRGSEVIMIPYT